MAEITASNSKGKGSKLRAPHIDLTPMVDLSFLLITFFIFTATLNNPTAMTTLLPADSTDSSKVPQSGAVSLVAGQDKVFFYTGNNVQDAIGIDYSSSTELRNRLFTLQNQLISVDGNDDKMFVMIKPSDRAEFGRVVDLLDEMKICQMKRYTLTDPTKDELHSLVLY